MKFAALKKLRQKWAADQPTYGIWITLESPSICEMAVALGLDWVVIDAEHGHLDWKEITEHIRAAVRSDTVVLVRLTELNIGLIKRALDVGADGIVIPWIENVAQLKQALAFSLFPPEGVRGIGGERATGWGQCFLEHTRDANEHVLVVPVIETVTAGRNIRELCTVNGIELYFIGPADYSSSAGYRGQWEGPGVAAQLLAIKDTVRNCGKQCGIISTSLEDLIERRQQRFRAIGLGSDCGLLLRSLRASLAKVGQDRRILPDFQPQPLATAPLPRPPKSVRPDRPEVVTDPDASPPVELAPGVALDVLVGARNNARGLTTDLVTFQPDSGLPYHTHPVTESITVLSGEFLVAVEGREYRLRILDNLVIPWGLPHQTRNASPTQLGVLHAAMASASPTRDLVSTQFEARPAPNGSPGVPGKERVTTFHTAPRSEAGPGTSFIDHFNKELVPGIEMSGGYGLFQPGGRLPAHFHDFDESICIIDGTATAVVEGRRYSMANYSTALQPGGRVHYFINESDRPMAMLWVYAGPVPERIIVDERCALPGGDPWTE